MTTADFSPTDTGPVGVERDPVGESTLTHDGLDEEVTVARTKSATHLELVQTPQQGTSRDSISNRVDAYTPDLSLRGMSEAVWNEWAPELRARAKSGAKTVGQVRSMLGGALSLLAFALDQRIPVKEDHSRLWGEGTIARYLKHLEAQDVPEASRTTVKSHLLRMASANPNSDEVPSDETRTSVGEGWPLMEEREAVSVDGLGLHDAAAYWDLLDEIGALVRSVHPDAMRAGSATPGRDRAIPYGTREVSRFLRVAHTLGRESARASSQALLALGLGAGLDGFALTLVQPQDVHSDNATGLVSVDVRSPEGQIVRRVPVLLPFGPKLVALAANSGDQTLLRSRQGSGSGINRPSTVATRLMEKDPHAVRVDSTRLRATWITVHLACGTPLPELMRMTGVTSLDPFAQLMPFTPTHRAANLHAPWTDSIEADS